MRLESDCVAATRVDSGSHEASRSTIAGVTRISPDETCGSSSDLSESDPYLSMIHTEIDDSTRGVGARCAPNSSRRTARSLKVRPAPLCSSETVREDQPRSTTDFQSVDIASSSPLAIALTTSGDELFSRNSRAEARIRS